LKNSSTISGYAECTLYRKFHDIMYLKKIAYHNFIDLLKEYQLGMTYIKVHDYLNGQIWDYSTNTLKTRHTGSRCYRDFFTKKDLNTHMQDTHLKHEKRKKHK